MCCEPEEHRLAGKLAYMAREHGTLLRKPCVICDDPVVDAHHEDYSQPLDVIWMCRLHHIRLHHCPDRMFEPRIEDYYAKKLTQLNQGLTE